MTEESKQILLNKVRSLERENGNQGAVIVDYWSKILEYFEEVNELQDKNELQRLEIEFFSTKFNASGMANFTWDDIPISLTAYSLHLVGLVKHCHNELRISQSLVIFDHLSELNRLGIVSLDRMSDNRFRCQLTKRGYEVLETLK